MKKNYALILTATLSCGLLVQLAYSDDQPPAGPASTNAAPAAAPKKKAVAPKKGTASKPATKKAEPAAAEPLISTVPLTPGPAVAKTPNVNVRGQAAINSEIVTHLKKGDKVTVLEEVTLKKPKTDEPAKWAKIALPAGTPVWVHTSFIDPNTKTVKPNRLNLRSGPGENYSIVGRIEKGTAIKELETKDEWTKIEAPSQAYGFVAAHLLANETGAPEIASATSKTPTPEAPATTPTPAAPATPVMPPTEIAVTTPPAPTPATEPTMPATPATPTPAPEVTTPAPAVTTPTEPTVIPAPAATPGPDGKEELVKRVISREGIVKRSVSIQAPSYFVLESLDTGKTVNYLFSPSTNLVLKDFKGQRIVVTGEEQLDERWPNTPVIYIDSVQAVP